MNNKRALSRRVALAVAAGACISPALAQPARQGGATGPASPDTAANDVDRDVGVTENLMREESVLRRILVLYSEVPPMLRRKMRIDVAALNDAATLFRDFGEVYHEKRVEEDRVFQEVAFFGGPAGRLVPILLRQHERGRAITSYILDQTKGGRLGDIEPLARALESMARMYQAHAAWEDTAIFPAWKRRQSKVQLDDARGEFEDIEHRMFGIDGFGDAVARVARIEQRLGLADLAHYTAPAPG